ncbi:MAG: glycosyltransferase [Acidobacteriia bacterium]|nr:glycosyltransferase [Terriglobia bacterium]
MSVENQLVSIVVPVFNEEAGIEQLKDKLLSLHGLLAHEFEMELVIVDDGSSDRTVERLRERFADAPVPFTITEHGTNRGIGAAFRTGFENCRGSLICTIDADCSYSPEGLRLLLMALRVTGADIAVASPYHPQGGVEGVPPWRLLLSQGCSQLYRWFSPLKLYTYTSIFRAYRATVIQSVAFRSNGFVSAAEILIAAGRRGYSVTEVPLVLRARTAGQSKMKIMRTIASHLAMLWSLIAPTATPARLAPRTSNALDDRN